MTWLQDAREEVRWEDYDLSFIQQQDLSIHDFQEQ
jgi:hypothetical protein